MIRHQYIGMDCDLELPGRLAQPAKKGHVIIRIAKYDLSIVAALDDVMGLIWDDESRKSGHDEIGAATSRSVRLPCPILACLDAHARRHGFRYAR